MLPARHYIKFFTCIIPQKSSKNPDVDTILCRKELRLMQRIFKTNLSGAQSMCQSHFAKEKSDPQFSKDLLTPER